MFGIGIVFAQEIVPLAKVNLAIGVFGLYTILAPPPSSVQRERKTARLRNHKTFYPAIQAISGGTTPVGTEKEKRRNATIASVQEMSAKKITNIHRNVMTTTFIGMIATGCGQRKKKSVGLMDAAGATVSQTSIPV